MLLEMAWRSSERHASPLWKQTKGVAHVFNFLVLKRTNAMEANAHVHLQSTRDLEVGEFSVNNHTHFYLQQVRHFSDSLFE